MENYSLNRMVDDTYFINPMSDGYIEEYRQLTIFEKYKIWLQIFPFIIRIDIKYYHIIDIDVEKQFVGYYKMMYHRSKSNTHTPIIEYMFTDSSDWLIFNSTYFNIILSSNNSNIIALNQELYLMENIIC